LPEPRKRFSLIEKAGELRGREPIFGIPDEGSAKAVSRLSVGAGGRPEYHG